MNPEQFTTYNFLSPVLKTPTTSETTPSGTAYAVFSARDMAGNRGTAVDQGGSFKIDTDGPAVRRLILNPASPIRNDAAAPVEVIVTLGLTEKVSGNPSLSYRLSGASREPIDIGSLAEVETQPGDVETWQGRFTLPSDAGLSQAESFFFSFEARDSLGNMETEIQCANLFQVYQGDDLPPLEIPLNFQAAVLSGGRVKLTWQAVTDAAGYQLYRAGGNTVTDADTIGEPLDAAVFEFIDTPGADGVYTYAVASVREENNDTALSGLSDAKTVNVDSEAPGAPTDLTLELIPQGILAQWQAPAQADGVTYRLYRANSEISSVAGLTALTQGIADVKGLDPDPSGTDHWYAVTSADAAGNESGPSNSVQLNVNLLPVSSVTVVQDRFDLPVVSWTHPKSGVIDGYELYQGTRDQGVKLNSGMLTTLSFTDMGYGGDERTYTLVAVDNGAESLARSLTLPKLTISLAEDEILRKGIMNEVVFRITNDSETAVANLVLKVEVAGRTCLSGEVDLQPGEAREVPVVIGGYDDLPDYEAALVVTAEITPNANETVRIIRDEYIPVGQGMLLLTISNEELVRGTNGVVRFTLENTGDAGIEVITAKSKTTKPSNEMIFYLVDEDGNILSTAPFKQAVGTQIVTLSNGDTVARIPSGAVFESDPVSMAIPSNAPDNMTIELDITYVYADRGKETQVRSLRLSRETIRKKREQLERFSAWLKDRGIETIGSLRDCHLQAWHGHLTVMRTRKGYPLKETAVNRHIITVRGWLKDLAEKGYVSARLLEQLPYLKEPRRLPGSVFTHKQVKGLLARIPTSDLSG